MSKARRRLAADAAWLAILIVAGLVSIYVDATLGYPRALALVAGKVL